KPQGAFGFYAGLNVLAFIMIFFFVPETKQRTLEELDYIFAVPLRKFMNYQTTRWLPWWFKRYILQDRSAKVAPLYHFHGVAGVPVSEETSREGSVAEKAAKTT